MIWSLLKILVFVAIIALLAVGAGILVEAAGGVQITVAGTEFTLGALQSVMAFAALVVLVWLFLKLLSLLIATLRFLNGDETALSRYFDKGRERKGYQALADGLMALASGEGKLAMAKAARAERYLQKPELTDLLIAQAAEMSGDTGKASETYRRLIENQQTSGNDIINGDAKKTMLLIIQRVITKFLQTINFGPIAKPASKYNP